MRLKPEYVEIIRQASKDFAGEGARVRLFGSRLDDSAKGGDVDLLLELNQEIKEPAELAARMASHISRKMHGRKVDVLISAPNLQHFPIHQIALNEGVVL